MLFGLQGCAQFPLEPVQEDATLQNFRNRNNIVNYSDPSGDISLGMSESEVYQNWGEPRRVQMAGSRDSNHQRWIYLNESSGHWRMKNARIVYFENGQVSGWETKPLRD